MSQEKMKEIVNFAKSRGFIYQNSEIYGGLSNTWDFGPLGVEIKRKIKDLWWHNFISSKTDMVGLDSSILMNPNVWKASGHIENFTDPLIDCKECHNRFRADHLIEQELKINVDGLSLQRLGEILNENKENLLCPNCGKANFTTIRNFNLMFKTFMGVSEDTAAEIYLRPETAQGIFVQFKNILQTTRKKLPFGVGQIGKSFRNEITPGNFIFRTREFEQMEIEFFVIPNEEDKHFNTWVENTYSFFKDTLGINPLNLRKRKHEKEELAHYSNQTTDVEFNFPFGWGEIAGVASRTDYDLRVHQELSKEDLTYFDPTINEKYLPYVIEPSFGVERAFLAILANAYTVEDLGEGKERIVLKIKYNLAPISIAVLPLKKNEASIVELSKNIIEQLNPHFKMMYDDTGSIGKLYRRQDEIGTPFCVTVDFESLNDKSVTVRNRDTMLQERIKIEDLKNYFLGYF